MKIILVIIDSHLSLVVWAWKFLTMIAMTLGKLLREGNFRDLSPRYKFYPASPHFFSSCYQMAQDILLQDVSPAFLSSNIRNSKTFLQHKWWGNIDYIPKQCRLFGEDCLTLANIRASPGQNSMKYCIQRRLIYLLVKMLQS